MAFSEVCHLWLDMDCISDRLDDLLPGPVDRILFPWSLSFCCLEAMAIAKLLLPLSSSLYSIVCCRTLGLYSKSMA